MNPNCSIFPPKQLISNQSMSLNTTGLRLLRCYSQHLRPGPAQFLGLRKGVLELRFLSSSVPSQKKPVHPVKAKRREAEDGVLDERDNGSVVLAARDKIGNSSGSGEGRIVISELHKEATDAYMAYAMSVLLGRALPDVRDGLKPVHRRIIFAMHELGLSSRKPYKKCARVVGEVLGKFHPHGDSAVYDSLVRMAQVTIDCKNCLTSMGSFKSLNELLACF